MKKLCQLAVLVWLWFHPHHAQAQNWTTVTATNITDLNQQKLAAGKLCFLGTDQNDIPISFQVGGGGQVLARPFCQTVTTGVVGSLTVPNPANTNPQNVYYRIYVIDSSTGQRVLTYTRAQFAGTTFAFDTYVPTGGPFSPLIAWPASVPNLTIGTLLVTGTSTLAGATSTGNIVGANPTAATSGADQNGPCLTSQGNYWTPGSSASDSWSICDNIVRQSGAPGVSQLTFTHAGSPSTGYSSRIILPNTALFLLGDPFAGYSAGFSADSVTSGQLDIGTSSANSTNGKVRADSGFVAGSSTYAGNASVSGTLGVTGTSTLGTVNSTTENVSGTATDGTLAVTNNASVSGMLLLNGSSSITSAPTSSGGGAGWKQCFYTTAFCDGVELHTSVKMVDSWFSVFNGPPSGNATVTTPDTNAQVSLNSNNGSIYAAGTQFHLNSSALIDKYGNVATVDQGVASIVYSAHSAGTNAAVSTTNFTTSATAGAYRLCAYIWTTTTGTGSTDTLTVTYDPGAGGAKTFTQTTSAGGLGPGGGFCQYVHVGSGSTLSYGITYGGTGGHNYGYDIDVERLN